MSRRRRRHGHPGAAPGTVEASPGAQPGRLDLMAFGPDVLTERTGASLEDLAALRAAHAVVWANVDGLGDLELLRGLARTFGLHDLALEDVLDPHQRPKLDLYDDHLFLVLRMFVAGEQLEGEQLSLFLGQGFVLTLQGGTPGDCLEPVRQRLRQAPSRIRRSGSDYLAYALVDAVVDHLFPVLELYDERLEALEEQVFAATGPGPAKDLQRIRRDLVALKRAAWPLREVLGALLREDTPIITAGTRPFLRDTHDHVIQQIDLIESHREMVSGLLDALLTVISNRMNEVMKVLTIIGTIFIPLSFVVGLYGMNFDHSASPWNMPELGWRYGYPFALGIMATVAGGLLIWFWRKGWLGR